MYRDTIFPSTLLCALLIPLSTHADPLVCGSGYTHATITDGTVVTVNVSETKQVGQLCLTMEDDNHRVVFDDCGAVIGKITESNAYGIPTKLSHTAIFELLESFKTVNDALVSAEPVAWDGAQACAFSVVERFTELQWGTGVFYRGALNAEAEGTFSFCPGQNKNTFVLTGEGCMRLK